MLHYSTALKANEKAILKLHEPEIKRYPYIPIVRIKNSHATKLHIAKLKSVNILNWHASISDTTSLETDVCMLCEKMVATKWRVLPIE